MIVKCNYSERSNSLRQKIHNGHLYRLLSKEGKHFEPHPSGAEKNKYGRKDLLTIAGWPHHQLLAHKMFLSEPTHIHPFILFMQEKNIKKYFPMWWYLAINEANKERYREHKHNTRQIISKNWKACTFFRSFHPNLSKRGQWKLASYKLLVLTGKV